MRCVCSELAAARTACAASNHLSAATAARVVLARGRELIEASAAPEWGNNSLQHGPESDAVRVHSALPVTHGD